MLKVIHLRSKESDPGERSASIAVIKIQDKDTAVH